MNTQFTYKRKNSGELTLNVQWILHNRVPEISSLERQGMGIYVLTVHSVCHFAERLFTVIQLFLQVISLCRQRRSFRDCTEVEHTTRRPEIMSHDGFRLISAA